MSESYGLSRRKILKGMMLLSAPMINVGSVNVFASSNLRYSSRAVDLVGECLVIDMLSILDGLQSIKAHFNGGSPFELSSKQVEKITGSGINVFHPALGLKDYDEAVWFFGYLNDLIADNEHFLRIDSVHDFSRLESSKKVGVIPGSQNSSHFRQVGDVDRFYDLGQRISQLTYNSQNLIGTGSTDRRDGGVSDFGAAVIGQMNKVGMAVDVSHCGDTTTLDAFDLSSSPVLITHSNCRELVPGHPRCKTDEAIKAMAKSGGVMGITGVRNFVRGKEPTTIKHFVDHIDHVANLVGVEHVGLGTDADLDGYDDLPDKYLNPLKSLYKGTYSFRDKIDIEGIDHPKKIFDITEELLRRKYSDVDIKNILGGNFRRVLGDIWRDDNKN